MIWGRAKHTNWVKAKTCFFQENHERRDVLLLNVRLSTRHDLEAVDEPLLLRGGVVDCEQYFPEFGHVKSAGDDRFVGRKHLTSLVYDHRVASFVIWDKLGTVARFPPDYTKLPNKSTYLRLISDHHLDNKAATRFGPSTHNLLF